VRSITGKKRRDQLDTYLRAKKKHKKKEEKGICRRLECFGRGAEGNAQNSPQIRRVMAQNEGSLRKGGGKDQVRVVNIKKGGGGPTNRLGSITEEMVESLGLGNEETTFWED